MSWKASMAQRQGANIGDHSGQPPLRPERWRRKPFTLRLWLPLTPLWILLAPFAVIAAPLVTLVPAARTIAPYRAAFAVVLLSLSRTAI